MYNTNHAAQGAIQWKTISHAALACTASCTRFAVVVAQPLHNGV